MADWYLTDDVADFLDRAGGFLRARAGWHTTLLTAVAKRLAGARFGWSADGGVCYLGPTGRLTVGALTAGQVAALVERLAGHPVTAVGADEDTSAAFTRVWRERTGAIAVPTWRVRLYRLGALTPPEPMPDGRAEVAGAADRARVIRWCADFAAAVGEELDVDAWDASRFGDKHYTFWAAADGTPVSMAAVTSMVSGMVRVDPVYTPTHLRGRGYAGAVTAAVSQAALDAGATDVVLYADPGNPTSNALYQRLGYARLAEFAGYDLIPR